MSKRARHPGLVLFTALLAVVACDRGDGDDSPQVLVSDSAGERHVVLADLDQFTAPRVRTELVYRTDTAANPPELFRVTGARFLADGSLAIANNGTQEILILGPDGNLSRRLGRSGEGPGEFRDISTLHVDPSNNLLAYDSRLGRLTTIGLDGTISGTRTLASPTRLVSLRPLTVLDDGRALAINWESRDFTVMGERRDSTPLFLFGADGTVSDTLGTWPAQEWNFSALPGGRGATKMPLGFGRTIVYAGRGGRAAIGSTDSLDVAVLGSDGHVVMRVRGSGPRSQVEPTELEAWRDTKAEQASRAPDFLQAAIVDAPHRETYPAFGSLLIDDEHRLWIGAYARPGQAEQKYVAIGRDGSLHGIVQLSAEGQAMDAALDRVVVLQKSELDEEYIEVLRIHWPWDM